MVATTPVTVDEFAAMPLEGMWELVDGEMIELSPTGDESGWVSGRIFSRIERFVDDHQIGWAFPSETGFILFDDRDTIRSPDAAFVQRDRLPSLTGGFVPMAPDLAVEVPSPTDRMAEAIAKVAMYLAAGVKRVWLIDPKTRTVTIFRLDEPPSKLGIGDFLDGGDVLPGFSVPVAEIFA